LVLYDIQQSVPSAAREAPFGAMVRHALGCDRRRLERHLSGCEGCTAYVERMRETVLHAGVLGEHRPAFRSWEAQ